MPERVPDPCESPLRFVVLRHIVGPAFSRTDQTHLDWMFEQPSKSSLRTFSTDLVKNWDQALTLTAIALPDHRSRYLDYEGPISDDRGSVEREFAGTFSIAQSTKDSFLAKMSWRDEQRHALTHFQRISPPGEAGNCETWTVSFEPFSPG